MHLKNFIQNFQCFAFDEFYRISSPSIILPQIAWVLIDVKIYSVFSSPYHLNAVSMSLLATCFNKHDVPSLFWSPH